MVLNDLLFSFKADSYKMGLITAHESFHAITSLAFYKLLKSGIDYSSNDLSMLFFLENISEEGVADLIDKPLLAKTGSPLKHTVDSLFLNSDSIATEYIKKLDKYISSFHQAGTLDKISIAPNTYSKNGGHFPGNFMGRMIFQAGLLPSLVENIEDPIHFVKIYNLSAKKLHAVTFSDNSIELLDKLAAKYYHTQ